MLSEFTFQSLVLLAQFWVRPEHIAGHDADLPAIIRRSEHVIVDETLAVSFANQKSNISGDVEPLALIHPKDGLSQVRVLDTVPAEFAFERS